MPKLTFELIINSASDLAYVNHITKMDVYAVITLHGDKTQKKHKGKTKVNRSGGSNPIWNYAVKFFVKEKLVFEGHLTLFIKLVSSRILGDKEIGGVSVPLFDLLRSQTSSTNGNGQGMNYVTYQVRTPSDKIKGNLTFSYRFSGASVRSGQMPTWVPPSQYGPQPPGYGYGGPPPPGYGYGGPPPLTRNEARLQTADTVFTVMSLFDLDSDS